MLKNLTHDEKMLLMLYFDDTRTATLKILKDMKSCLAPDEQELLRTTDSLISKLEAATDEEVQALDLLEGFI